MNTEQQICRGLNDGQSGEEFGRAHLADYQEDIGKPGLANLLRYDMEKFAFFFKVYGDGYGDGSGYGFGNGGEGEGDGSGDGNGLGDGDGYGSCHNGYGDGDGSGDGNGYGDGNGNRYGDGD